MTFSEIIGAIGVSILLIGYLMNLNGKLPADSPWYMLMNVIGSGMAFYSSYLIDFLSFFKQLFYVCNPCVRLYN